MVNFTKRTFNNDTNGRLVENEQKPSLDMHHKSVADDSGVNKMKMKTNVRPVVSESNDTLKMTNRNTFAFWIIVWLISVLTVGNLVLTLTIFGVLRLGKGMEFLELVPEAEAIKFFGSVDLDKIYKRDGIIEGFYDVPMTITGDKSDLSLTMIKANGQQHNRMLMSKNGTHFSGINQFDLKHPMTNEIIFTTHKPIYNLPSGGDNLVAKSISSSRITAAINEELTLNTTQHKKNSNKISIRGSEGVKLNGQEIILDADSIHFTTHNGSIYLTNNHGIYLDMKRIPIVQDKVGLKNDEKQYKICVCMPEGRLFRVTLPQKHNNVRDLCNYANMKHDPCM